MQKFIARLIDCGSPRLTAMYICRHFRLLNRLFDGRWQDEVWPVMDELMTTIRTIYPRLYDAVMAKF